MEKDLGLAFQSHQPQFAKLKRLVMPSPNMPTPYSLDLRKRVIAAYEAKEESLRQIAQRFQVSLSFVRDLTRRYRETQQIAPKAHRGGATAKLGAEHLAILKQLIQEHPQATLAELCERLAEQTQIRVSISTLHRAVQNLAAKN